MNTWTARELLFEVLRCKVHIASISGNKLTYLFPFGDKKTRTNRIFRTRMLIFSLNLEWSVYSIDSLNYYFVSKINNLVTKIQLLLIYLTLRKQSILKWQRNYALACIHMYILMYWEFHLCDTILFILRMIFQKRCK